MRLKRVALCLILLLAFSVSAHGAIQLSYPKFHATNPTTGAPLVGGLVYTYKPGTSTPQTTYSDVALTVPNTNPVVLDSNGDAVIYGATPKKLVLKNSAGVLIWTMDNVGGASLNGDSIKDYGAVGDGIVDDTTSIQAAIDAAHAAGGGSVYVPAPSVYYKISVALVMYSNVELYGSGYASHIHSTNTTRLGAITATGTSGAKLSNIKIHDLRLTSTTNGIPGTPDGIYTGNGIAFTFCDDSQLYNLYVSNWSDAGISVICGDRNNIHHNNVKGTAQNIQIGASTIDSVDNQITNNILGATLLYDSIDLEGAWGGPGNTGIVKGTIVANNQIADAWNLGIMSQVAVGSIITGNRVTGSGVGNVDPNLLHGLYLKGSLNSVVNGNEVESSLGYGVVIGGGSNETSVSGNTTKSNSLGSCLCTDSGVAVVHDIAMGINSWTEGDIAIDEVSPGNVTFLSRTQALTFPNPDSCDSTLLGRYGEKDFTPVVVGTSTAGTGTYSEQIGTTTRIGNRVFFNLQLAWSAHDGTGNITITGLPWTPANTQRFAATVYEGGVPITAGNQMEAYIDQGAAVVHLAQVVPTTGIATAVPMASSSAGINISGSYITTAP